MKIKAIALAAALLLALGACTESGSLDPSVSSLVDGFEDEIAQASEVADNAIDEMDARLADVEVPEDVQNEWNDLSADLRDMVSDALTDADTVDLSAMTNRLDGFTDRLGDLAEDPDVRSAWDEMRDALNALQTLVND